MECAKDRPLVGKPHPGKWHPRLYAAELVGTALLVGGGVSIVIATFGQGSPLRAVTLALVALIFVGYLPANYACCGSTASGQWLARWPPSACYDSRFWQRRTPRLLASPTSTSNRTDRDRLLEREAGPCIGNRDPDNGGLHAPKHIRGMVSHS